jgi:hypothetical protein
MLADELPPKHIVFSRINVSLHDQLAKDVERFKANGGKIKQCAIGETAEFQTINAKAEAVKRGGQNGANTKKLDAKLKRTNNEN